MNKSFSLQNFPNINELANEIREKFLHLFTFQTPIIYKPFYK